MMSAAELVRKLGIKEAFTVAAINANYEVLARIQEGLPQGTILATKLPSDRQVKIIIVWLTEADDLDQEFRRLRQAITPDGAIWAVIPKKRTRKKATNVTFDNVQAVALKTDLVDNKVASFSEREYGIRFVIRREKR